MTTPETLAAALAAVQAELPPIDKARTAKVEMKGGGSYSYTYADLASISEAVLPLLARHGLAFLCRPALTDQGFGLWYSLLHVSGEREDGFYPLPSNGTPQAVGSAITYARRYVLCAVTGVAPEDDDGQAAQREAERPRVDLSQLDAAIGAARELGIEGDYEGTREWAAQSQQNADAAARKLRRTIEAKRAADAEPPVPAGTPESQPAPSDEEVADAPEPVKPAADEPAPESSEGDVPPSSPSEELHPDDVPLVAPKDCSHDGSIDRIGIARTRCRACGTIGGPDGPGTTTPDEPADEAAPADAEPSGTDDSWRSIALGMGVAPTAVLAALVKGWDRSNMHARPNRLADVDRLAATEDGAALVADTIGDVAKGAA